jgi:hypothetical protein
LAEAEPHLPDRMKQMPEIIAYVPYNIKRMKSGEINAVEERLFDENDQQQY